MYFLLGLSVALAILLLGNIVGASLATLAWRMVADRVSELGVRRATSVIFTLRVAPVALSAVAVGAYIVPAYLQDEPWDSGEVVSLKLAVIAALSSLGVLAAVTRVVRSSIATLRLTRDWQRNGVSLSVPGIGVPVYRIEHEFPVIAVIGILRPRLFVASVVLQTLVESELAAALAHECGHLAARDNLKRTVLRICRDLVLLPAGTSLDAAWAENAEAVADEYAAVSGRGIALELASALVKIARIVPEGSSPKLPAGAYLIDGFNVDITSRVRRLVHFSDGPDKHGAARGFSALTIVSGLCLMLLALLPLLDTAFLDRTHHAIEGFVSLVK